MTKTTDQQLKHWLNAFKVDTSAPRLSRLEDRILLSVSFNHPPFFQALSLKDGILAGLGAVCIAAGVLWFDHLTQSNDLTTYVLASSYLYGGF